MAVPPSALMRSAVSSMVSGRPYGERLPRTLRPVQYTIAPASPKARAIPRPAPRVAPATTATCPVSDRAEFCDAAPGRVGRREFGLFFRRAMIVQEFSTCLPTEMSGDGTTCTPAGRVRRDEVAWGHMQCNCLQATDLDVRSQVAAGIRFGT